MTVCKATTQNWHLLCTNCNYDKL